jgi:hypothetical protein
LELKGSVAGTRRLLGSRCSAALAKGVRRILGIVALLSDQNIAWGTTLVA